MPTRTYLTNKENNTKFRLNGIIRSTNPPNTNAMRLCAGQNFLLAANKLPPKVDLRPDMTSVENQSSAASW